jgi:hypothetical protein
MQLFVLIYMAIDDWVDFLCYKGVLKQYGEEVRTSYNQMQS